LKIEAKKWLHWSMSSFSSPVTARVASIRRKSISTSSASVYVNASAPSAWNLLPSYSDQVGDKLVSVWGMDLWNALSLSS
jgi:hypothetical protein